MKRQRGDTTDIAGKNGITGRCKTMYCCTLFINGFSWLQDLHEVEQKRKCKISSRVLKNALQTSVPGKCALKSFCHMRLPGCASLRGC